ncbi:hypothetical protein ES703_121090 [subsurface metagenome]
MIISAIKLSSSPNAPPYDVNSPVLAKVDRVVDGDTIELSNGETVRLIGVDTPELHHPSRPVEYFATEAKVFVEQIASDCEVKLMFGKERRGKYGRLLAYVYLPDGTFLNAEIIKQGYGFAYTKYPFEFMDDFVRYETKARQAKLGLWNGDGIKELQWLKSQERKAFKIYDMANNRWAIEYQGMAKTYLTAEGLNNELAFMRKSAYGLSPRDLRLECIKRGWCEIKSEKKGDVSNEKQTD